MSSIFFGRLGRGLACACLLTLGACASFDGQPRPVLQPVAAIDTDYVPSKALEDYYAKGSEDERRRYRDTVIGIYMTAADANFLEFRRMLSREMKGANFGLGLAVVGLTNAASFAAERTANILSAGAAGLTGAQGKLSREVYFEKTLPALFAGMEANRTKARTSLITRMSEGDTYSLTQAFADLARYEAAASVDSAIELVTAQASQEAADAQADYDLAVEYTVPPAEAGVRDARVAIKAKLAALARAGDANSLAKLANAARAVGAQPGETGTASVEAIMTILGPETNKAKTDALIAKIETALAGG